MTIQDFFTNNTAALQAASQTPVDAFDPTCEILFGKDLWMDFVRAAQALSSTDFGQAAEALTNDTVLNMTGHTPPAYMVPVISYQLDAQASQGGITLPGNVLAFLAALLVVQALGNLTSLT